MQAEILEVCIGQPQEIEVNGQKELSGIFKLPFHSAVDLTLTNLAGDGQADLRFHGGPHKAVYVYSANYYDFWKEDLGRKVLEPSQFGQNLTVAGLSDDEVCLGDQFQLGQAKVTVVQPRIPCAKLGVRLGDPDFPARFLLAGYLGYYLKVDEPGTVASGNSMRLIQRVNHGYSVRALWQTVFTEDRDLDLIRFGLGFEGLDEGWKKRLRNLDETS
ncbi:MAG: MOSC domain-containing protein [Gammaproteobacteria bacterium]|nr:MOSC domain-containing protein [Gammaproteobacteria bacterium]